LAAQIRAHAPFLLVLAAAAATRVTTLIVSQRHVHSDEAIIGLMAKHIVEGRSLPLYFWGQDFNGGGAFEAYLAAGSFAILGVGVAQLKLVVVLLSLGSLTFLYAFALRFFDRGVALFGALFYACAPTLVAWHYQVRGGYGELQLFVLAVLALAFAIAEGRARAWVGFALGLVSGFALFCIELVLPTLLVVAGYLALGRRDALRGRRGLAAAAGFVLGYAPSLLYNLLHGGANWRALLEQRLAGGGGLGTLLEPGALAQIFAFEIPRFFGPDTVLRYRPDLPLSAWLFTGVAAIAIAHALWHYRAQHREAARALFRGGEARIERDRYGLLLSVAAADFALYLVLPTRAPSYLLGALPALALLAGVWLSDLRRLAPPFGPAAVSVLLVAACGSGLWESAQLLARDRIESLEPRDGQLVATHHDGETIRLVIEHLRSRGIEAVFSSPSFQYPIIFESGEQILASSRALPWRYIVHLPYEEAVVEAIQKRPVFVLERDSPYRARAETVLRSLAPGRLDATVVGELVVIEAATGEAPRGEPLR